MCRQIVLKYRGFLKMEPYNFRSQRKHFFKPNVPKPTFTEFIRFIVDEHKANKEMDMHWEPAYRFCTPCQVKSKHMPRKINGWFKNERKY